MEKEILELVCNSWTKMPMQPSGYYWFNQVGTPKAPPATGCCSAGPNYYGGEGEWPLNARVWVSSAHITNPLGLMVSSL